MIERYLRQGPLAAMGLAARSANAPGSAGVRLSDRGFLGQLSLRGSGDGAFSAAVEAALGLAPPVEPNRVAERDGVRILWLGPDEWLAIVPEGKEEDLARRLIEQLQGQHAAVADTSEARAAIGLAGPAAREVMSLGCSLDLHPRAFKAGTCAQTLLARVPVILHQLDEAPSYDIYVQRSLAEYLWRWLEDAARDFGVAVAEG